jgi:hypothetical protein
MATQGKVEADAKRMGSRGFGGYVFDRATGSHDFRADTGAEKPGGASERPLETRTTRRKGVTDDAYAAGGSIKANSREYGIISPAGKNVHEKRNYASGGMVLNTSKTDAAGGPVTQRRGYGKARGA